ncbi:MULTISPECIES: hypothetical protein [unclassified Synechococcus]|uniref:hypothetical protein n=1 Tax=unclassified Synechococcus TaxID=2626047 RepID=UPI0020CE7147|nr:MULTISPECIES: hypothetical protein [unclassified Synechococcus]
MVSKRSSPATAAQAVPTQAGEQSFSDWIAGAIDQGVKPEQALAVVGLGLMRGMGGSDYGLPLFDPESSPQDGPLLVQGIKARLEAIALAIETGAPLSTQEVSLLIGARPGNAKVRRAGVVAERIGRNVWQLRRSRGEDREAASTGFSEGFRRRL